MICQNCGRTVDDDVRVCPFCGSMIEPAGPETDDRPEEKGPIPVTLSGKHPAAELRRAPESGVEENEPEVFRKEKSFFTPAFALSLLAFILSLVCLVMLMSLRGGIAEMNKAVTDSLDAVNATVSATRRLPAPWTRGGITRCSSCAPRAI